MKQQSPSTLAVLLASLVVVVSLPSRAAPLCAGATSVSALGAGGCEFGGVTFSDFSISNGTASGSGNPAGFDPNEILIDIGPGQLNTGFFTSVPAIEVEVSPTDAANWTAGGVFGGSGGISFTLDYTVTASVDFFDLYQLTAIGNNAFRGGDWSVNMSVTNGSGPLVRSVDSLDFFPLGTFDPGVTVFNVSNLVSVSGDIFTGSVSRFANDYTLSPVPVPAAVWLFGSALLGLGALKRRKT